MAPDNHGGGGNLFMRYNQVLGHYENIGVISEESDSFGACFYYYVTWTMFGNISGNLFLMSRSDFEDSFLSG